MITFLLMFFNWGFEARKWQLALRSAQLLPAQPPVERVRVGVEGGRERVEEVGLRHAAQLTIA